MVVKVKGSTLSGEEMLDGTWPSICNYSWGQSRKVTNNHLVTKKMNMLEINTIDIIFYDKYDFGKMPSHGSIIPDLITMKVAAPI